MTTDQATAPTLNAAISEELRAEVARQRTRQRVIADALDISRGQVSQRLNGVVPLRVDEVAAIARLLDIPFSELARRAEATLSDRWALWDSNPQPRD